MARAASGFLLAVVLAFGLVHVVRQHREIQELQVDRIIANACMEAVDCFNNPEDFSCKERWMAKWGSHPVMKAPY